MPWFWQGVLLLIFTVPVIVLFGYATWDVIRRHDANLAVRALWLIAFCVLPIIGPLIYLVIRPPGTTADQRRIATQMAVLAKVHLSRLEYQSALQQYTRADEIWQADAQIAG